MIDYIDFYVVGPDDPNYNDTYLIEDDIISVIIQKYKNIIFTNKGDVLGDPNFGAGLEYLLYETKVSEDYVKTQINEQIYEYIPEMVTMNYTLDVAFSQDVVVFQDALYIYLNIADYEVYAQFGKSIY